MIGIVRTFDGVKVLGADIPGETVSSQEQRPHGPGLLIAQLVLPDDFLDEGLRLSGIGIQRK